MRTRWKWLLGAVVAVVIIGVGAPFVYIHFIEGPAPARLSLPTASTVATTAGSRNGATDVSGTYHVGAGSEAGYRVSEVLIGQHATAVGRTSTLWGTVTIAGDQVTGADITVNMATVVSDQSERNAQFDGRIMDVSQYPTATLKLASPITLGTIPALGAKTTYGATGTLDLHGVTRTVHFSLQVERSTTGIYALADLPIAFADWDIANPSVGGFVTTASSGTLEALVFLTLGAGNPVDTRAGTNAGSGGSPGPVTVPRTTVPAITIPAG
jgi:polyisoprenoid-binding protein YceI